MEGQEGGLILSSDTNGPTAWFSDTRNLHLWGTDVFCGSATVRAKTLTATTGISAVYGTNSLVVSATNTTITGPTVVSGSLICGALTATSIVASADCTFTNLTQTSTSSLKSLVLGQTTDISGPSYLTIQNRTGLHGAQISTVTDSVFVNGNTEI